MYFKKIQLPPITPFKNPISVVILVKYGLYDPFFATIVFALIADDVRQNQVHELRMK